MLQRFPMTPHGCELLKAELERLKAGRARIVDAIAEARGHGDLKENAEYHAAREEQGLSEAKISTLEGQLAAAQVIDITQIPHTGKVIFGATVDLLLLNNKEEDSRAGEEGSHTEKEVCYVIVGENEMDIKAGKISIASPIARALIGKEEGETVRVKIPDGDDIEYEILEVRHI